MRGRYLYNFPAFDRAKARLVNAGNEVISPADLDRDLGLDPKKLPVDHNFGEIPEGFDLAEAARRDLEAIIASDAIFLLDGWEESKGALAELYIARWLGKEIIYETLPETDPLKIALEITSGDRQASYGPPDQDFARTAAMWTGLFSSMLKPLHSFEPYHVALAMILLKASRQLHQMKDDNWVDIAGYARCGWVCDQVKRGELS